jgi:hypothetical protein
MMSFTFLLLDRIFQQNNQIIDCRRYVPPGGMQLQKQFELKKNTPGAKCLAVIRSILLEGEIVYGMHS